jgi:hypothetical protein
MKVRPSAPLAPQHQAMDPTIWLSMGSKRAGTTMEAFFWLSDVILMSKIAIEQNNCDFGPLLI